MPPLPTNDRTKAFLFIILFSIMAVVLLLNYLNKKDLVPGWKHQASGGQPAGMFGGPRSAKER